MNYTQDKIKNYELCEKVIKKLIEKKMIIASAESCTGGLFAKMITDISGSSSVFNEGYITYANEVKTKVLGVKEETLKSYGAVSSQTADEMVVGLKKVSGADVCVCFTGIAGPGGGTAEKPVGLVYMGIIFKDEKEIIKLNLDGSRDEVRNKACIEAFSYIIKKLK